MATDPDGSPEPDESTESEEGGVADDDQSERPRGDEDPAMAALHRVELGREWVHRAHGHIVTAHHNTGHAMDHFAAAEELFRESGHEDLANELRDEFLPRGVFDDTWSYALLEAFEEGIVAGADEFDQRARDRLTDGRRHVVERRQERRWKDRAEESE